MIANTISVPSTSSSPFMGMDRDRNARVCSWCPGAQALTEALEREGIPTTHGMCDTCLANIKLQNEARHARTTA